MAYNENLHVETFEAGAADDPLEQFRAVVLDSAGQIEYPAGRGTVDVIGITQDNNGAAQGDAVQVGPALLGGKTKVEAGEAIAVNEDVCFGADGRALDADTSNDAKLAIALEAATAAGEIITVKFTGFRGLVP
jgi:hypothetical protein